VEAERSRLLTAAFVRVWLATLGAFASFGMVVLALPLYTKDVLDRGAQRLARTRAAAALRPDSGRGRRALSATAEAARVADAGAR
jgi:hypothetical protein